MSTEGVAADKACTSSVVRLPGASLRPPKTEEAGERAVKHPVSLTPCCPRSGVGGREADMLAMEIGGPAASGEVGREA